MSPSSILAHFKLPPRREPRRHCIPTLRPLPQRTWRRKSSSVLPYALLFLALHDDVSAATVQRHHNENRRLDLIANYG
jgi:hypothetical protein